MLSQEQVDRILRGEVRPPKTFCTEDSERYGSTKNAGQMAKAKVKDIKASIKRRKNIDPQEYRDLLIDRRKRLQVIATLLPIISDRYKLVQLGVSDAAWCQWFKNLADESDNLETNAAAFESLECLEKLVFDEGLTRSQAQKGFSVLGVKSGTIEVAELGIDFHIWWFKGTVRALGRHCFGMSAAQSEDLLSNPALAAEIKYVIDENLTVPTLHLGSGCQDGFQWRVTRQQAQRLIAAFPSDAHGIEAGIID